MCVYSMIADSFEDRWKWKYVPSEPYSVQPKIVPLPDTIIYSDPPAQVTKSDLDLLRDELKKEIQILIDLLKKAKIYDAENQEPDCELEDKKKRLKEIAQGWGLDIEFP
jgi:hypothetical protein